MSFKAYKFVACPGGDLKVEVRMHDTEKSLARAYGQKCWGFCEWDNNVKRDDPKVACRVHFCRRSMSYPVLAHEAFHAVTALRGEMGMPGHEPHIDEVLAETMENIVRNVIIFCENERVVFQTLDLPTNTTSGKV